MFKPFKAQFFHRYFNSSNFDLPCWKYMGINLPSVHPISYEQLDNSMHFQLPDIKMCWVTKTLTRNFERHSSSNNVELHLLSPKYCTEELHLRHTMWYTCYVLREKIIIYIILNSKCTRHYFFIFFLQKWYST